jgi:inhibitor of cysteine peptidase
MTKVFSIVPRVIAFAAVVLSLAACTPGGQPTETPSPVPGEPTATPEVTIGMASVEDIEIVMLESFPVQVRVFAKGYLADSCTKMGAIKQERQGNSFKVTITTMRPTNLACADVISPFEETIPLDVAGLKAGTYTVDVNGVTDTFTLSVDNALR